MNNESIIALNNDLLNEKGVRVCDNEWDNVARELHEVKSTIKLLKTKESALKKKLVELSGNLSSYNDVFLFERIQRIGTLDYPKIIKVYGVDVEPFRKDPIVVWKLSKV